MSALDRILGIPDRVEDTQVYRGAWLEAEAQNETLTDEVRYLSGEIREIREDLLRVSDAFDNIGWSPIEGREANEMPLKTVKRVAEVARAMLAANPFIKRGVQARIGYIWGKGVKYDGIEGVKDQFGENRAKLFSPQAYEELERVLATDGNAFVAIPITGSDNKGNPLKTFRVPLDNIEGSISNPLDKEEIWYFKRSYKVVRTKADTGEEEEVEETKWYASLAYYQQLKARGKNLPRRWNKHGVEQNYVIQHTAVNKQVGWRWGLPDIMPVIFWAKAYKEYLEDNANLVKAYSRLAWQVKVPGAQAGNAASAQVMRPPQRDPLTGELQSVGGTFVGTTEMQPMPATGSSVDFAKGNAMAAAVAAGLEISLVVLLSDSGASNRAAESSLDLPTLKAMESRQQVHIERFMQIFEFWGAKVDLNMSSQLLTIEEEREIWEAAGEKPEPSQYASVIFPPINTDSNKDHMAALGTGVELGVIYPAEARREMLEMMNISPIKPWWELPTLDDNPAKREQMEQEERKAEQEFQRAQSVIPAQGRSGGVTAKGGQMTNNNEARDARKRDSNNA